MVLGGSGASRGEGMKERASIALHVKLAPDTLLGPGKAYQLEGVRDTRSIAAAGRRVGMSVTRLRSVDPCRNKPNRLKVR
jgi:molybdate transport system regulatory protein